MYYKIFIDTNIYDGANYSFQNAAFSAIRSRGKNKELELHINSVVEGEVKKHIVRFRILENGQKKQRKNLKNCFWNVSVGEYRSME